MYVLIECLVCRLVYVACVRGGSSSLSTDFDTQGYARWLLNVQAGVQIGMAQHFRSSTKKTLSTSTVINVTWDIELRAWHTSHSFPEPSLVVT